MPQGPGNITKAGPPNNETIRSTLRRMFGDLTELKVVTVVGDMEVSLQEEDGRTKTRIGRPPESPAAAFITIFDLVDGDVTNVIPSSVKDDDGALRAYHAAQVEKSLAVLPGNIKALMDLGTRIIDDIKEIGT